MKRTKRLLSLILIFALIFSTFEMVKFSVSATDTDYSVKHIQNGGFDEGKDKYTFSNHYVQPARANVPYWDTTATDGKLEFFENGATYHFKRTNDDKTLQADPNFENYKKVSEGEVAAELNANEESTIYQRIKTFSGSTYTWGLDHRGRDTTDRMVLIIGPKQPVNPSKSSKKGQDQFMRITEWLKTQYDVDYPETGCSQKYTVYTKKFAASGKFEGQSANEDENISMVENGEINQEWSVWVISSPYCNTKGETTTESGIKKIESVNGWSAYGTNSINDFDDIMNGASSSLGYDCTYTVPKGQEDTLFAFCSYSSGRLSNNNIIADATYGNLLDGINFDLYQPISTSITEGGKGSTEVEDPELSNVTIKSDITNGDALHSVVLDGQYCRIYTTKYNGGSVKECNFEGAYITVNEADGTPVTKFLKVYDGDLSGLTEEEKKAKAEEYFIFEPTEVLDPETGEVVETWDYYCRVLVEAPIAVHLIYTKAPYVLYDSNGGAHYMFTSDNKYGGNLVGFSDSFKTATDDNGNVIDTSSYYYNSEYSTASGGETIEVIKEGKYISHAALPNKDWEPGSAEFCGWSVTKVDGDNVEQIIIDGVHTITYNPTNGDGGIVSITDSKNNVTDLQLDASHGITLTAVWKFKTIAQAQTRNSDSGEFENSALGGTIEETLISGESGNENISETIQNINDENRVVKIEASGSVGDKVMFKAKPDYTNEYMFTGWYCYNSETGEYELRTKSTSIAVTLEEGKLDTYYARFEKVTFPVVFKYTLSGNPDDYDFYDNSNENKYGNYFQEVAYGKTATKPENDSKSVKTWFTSPTERGTEYIFDFANTKITEKTELYAGPSFSYNYFNFFKLKEPWYINTYGTVKVNGQYIDLKDDSKVTDYNVYILKGTLDESAPNPSYIKENATMKAGKSVDNDKLIYNNLTNSGKTINRAGVKFNDFYLFNMKTPVWVVFDFTYNGVKYTSTVKDRCLYNNITTYLSEAEKGYSDYPPEEQAELRNAQVDLLNCIQGIYDASPSGITEPTAYADAVPLGGLTYDNSSTEQNYTFESTTAIRNIEPWGLKYTFKVNEKAITEFDDYGAVVFTDRAREFEEGTVTIENLLYNEDSLYNENSIMYSKSNNNVYSGDDGTIEVYYVNNMLALDFDKNTYAVFFVKDSDGKYYYSNVVSNSYNSIAEQDTSAISKSIMDYSKALINYTKLVKQAEGKNS